jgi:hypothetical protein
LIFSRSSPSHTLPLSRPLQKYQKHLDFYQFNWLFLSFKGWGCQLRNRLSYLVKKRQVRSAQSQLLLQTQMSRSNVMRRIPFVADAFLIILSKKEHEGYTVTESYEWSIRYGDRVDVFWLMMFERFKWEGLWCQWRSNHTWFDWNMRRYQRPNNLVTKTTSLHRAATQRVQRENHQSRLKEMIRCCIGHPFHTSGFGRSCDSYLRHTIDTASWTVAVGVSKCRDVAVQQLCPTTRFNYSSIHRQSWWMIKSPIPTLWEG